MTTAMRDDPSELLAAVDLGSNSFHMIVGRLDDGGLSIIDRMRERVRLGAGLDARQRLTADAEQRALDCLGRFGERLRRMSPGRVRVVGTNTLRRLRDSEAFLYEARLALGHPIEVIAGQEEARLIYLGVAQSMPGVDDKRLVVDIGGGSTECIIGRKDAIVAADSLFMGCVSFSLRYFPDGALTAEAFEAAEVAAQLELQPIIRAYRDFGWGMAVGCSGTIHAIRKVVDANGWSPSGQISADGLRRVTEALRTAGRVGEVKLDGLQDDRRPVIAGGVAILNAIFDAFDIEIMTASPGALREGALYDLVGRIQHVDVRDRTIGALQRRHGVDEHQVRRVRGLAVDLWSQVAKAWDLERPSCRRLLEWAASLHEIGLSISYTGYHKHSAYLVANGDMAGFSTTFQNRLAAIIRSHRRKMKASTFDGLGPDHDETVRLAVLFRLAVGLCRSRSDDEVPTVHAKARRRHLALGFSDAWLKGHPMSVVDLRQHAESIARVGIELEFT